MRVVLEVVADLGRALRFEQRLEPREHGLAVELRGCVDGVVRERHIGGAPGLDAERYADDARLHVVEAGGLGVEGDEVRRGERREPTLEGRFVEHELVVARRVAHRRVGVQCGGVAARRRGRGQVGRGCRGAIGGGAVAVRATAVAAAELGEQVLEAEPRVELAQRGFVGRAPREVGGLGGQVEIAVDGGELARQL